MVHEREMGILRRTERHMVRAMCGIQLKDRKRAKYMVLGLNEVIDHMAYTNSVLC